LPLNDISLTDSAMQIARKYELTDPDVRLMLQVRDGNADAFEQLVEKYQDRLISVLEHLVPTRGHAEDLAQEVFMRVYRARASYIPGAKFSTWLFTITHNVASNAIRKMSRRKEVNLTNSPSGKVPVRPLDSMAKEKSGLMPTLQTDRKEIKVIVEQAVKSLNERQRMALLLKYFEGMSYVDIGKAMELSSQAVKSLLSRARGNLCEILQPYIDSGQLPAGGVQFDVPSGPIDPRDTDEFQAPRISGS
jgi:RNA polymerase sigma-70 factor (ECF subfamily)